MKPGVDSEHAELGDARDRKADADQRVAAVKRTIPHGMTVAILATVECRAVCVDNTRSWNRTKI